MDVFVTEMEEGKGLLPHLLRDTLYTTQFESALNALALAGRNAKEMTDNLQKLTQQINDKDNLINVLSADSSAANKMKEVLRSATSASEKLDENMTAMRSNFLLRRYFKNKEKESGE
jgi:phospholipid/cholesterol/gamma-HCH transport system substrate-binding protein